MLVNGYHITEAVDKINKNCLYKNKDWFYRYIVSKGYFAAECQSEDDRINIANTLEGFRDILNSVYKENWAFFFRSLYSLPFIHILYPKIEINNSRGENHTIRDLVVQISLEISEDNKIRIKTNLKGTRLTVSKAEFLSGYQHSHLFSTDYSDYKFDLQNSGDFCLGRNEVPEVMFVFNDTQDLGTFELLLLTINNMMNWESLEGVPYQYIRNISIRTNSNEKYSVRPSHVDTVSSCIKTILKDCHFDMMGNKIRIIEDDEFQRKLLKDVILYSPEVVCIRDGNTFFKTKLYENNLRYIRREVFCFKNEKIGLKIYNNRKNTIEEDENKINYIIHPDVYSNAVQEINNNIYEKCIEYYTRENRR